MYKQRLQGRKVHESRAVTGLLIIRAQHNEDSAQTEGRCAGFYHEELDGRTRHSL